MKSGCCYSCRSFKGAGEDCANPSLKGCFGLEEKNREDCRFFKKCSQDDDCKFFKPFKMYKKLENGKYHFLELHERTV